MSVSKQLEQTFLLEEINKSISIRLDSSKLVREIKNYPIIYDNNLRRDQTCIFNAWENICTRMVGSFPSMTENDRMATRKRLKDRWSYMRSTFRRDVFNNNIDCHNHLDWIQEINFLVPILIRPPAKTCSSRNSRRRTKHKSSSNKKKTPSKVTSTTTTTSNTPVQSPTLQQQTVILNTTESSISDTIISCDSSSSDKSMSFEILSSNNTTEIAAEIKCQNDLMVETFMSTFNLDSILATPIDPDQKFLLTILQNYRMVRNENKEALQHKFYTFLRD